MHRTAAERVAVERSGCSTTVQAKCNHCDSVREFLSDETPEFADRANDLALYAWTAGLRGAGYETGLGDDNDA
jgi:hypothetical protein